MRIDPDTATAILVAHTGGVWQPIVPGSLKLEPLAEAVTAVDSTEDYGFTAEIDGGRTITGRLSALVAVIHG